MMFANGQPGAWVPKKYQATPDPTAWIPIGETSREREEREGNQQWALPVCQAMGRGGQTCMLVRRAFCNGGTDLILTPTVRNSSSKKCEITSEGTSKRQRWDFHSGLFQMIRPPLQHGANSQAWYKDEMCVLFTRRRQRVGRTIRVTHSSEHIIQFS